MGVIGDKIYVTQAISRMVIDLSGTGSIQCEAGWWHKMSEVTQRGVGGKVQPSFQCSYTNFALGHNKIAQHVNIHTAIGVLHRNSYLVAEVPPCCCQVSCLQNIVIPTEGDPYGKVCTQVLVLEIWLQLGYLESQICQGSETSQNFTLPFSYH